MKIVALWLTVLTGFTGLVYEVTWQKCLAILLGSHSEATAAVLGIFLGGLSLGYSLFGRITRRLVARAQARGRAPRLLVFYGCVEAAIGLHALVFTQLFALAQAASLRVPVHSDAASFAVDVGLTLLLIGPPTVLMGGTIPVLTQALARSLADATRVHAHVYAFNTAGAFAGALAAGFVLVPWLGIEGVLRWMGGVNLLAGSLFLWVGSRRVAAPSPPLPETEAPPQRALPDMGAYAGVALLLGFAMMAIQTVLIRIGGLALGASHFTFSMVVAVFVLCIALGSISVSAAPRIPRAALPAAVWGFGLCFGLLYLFVEDAPYYAHVLRTYFDQSDADFYPYYLSVFGALLLLIGLPVGLAGASLPLLFHHLRSQVGDLGALAGRLYSWNTVGNLLGALLGGYGLLLWLDLHDVYRVALGALVLAGVVLTLRVAPVRRRAVLVAGMVALGALLLLPRWDPYLLSSGLFRFREAQPLTGRGPETFFKVRSRSIDFYDDDPAASVAVKGGNLSPLERVRAIVTNGKSDGSTHSDYPTMALAGLIPCLLADGCERSFVIGWGTGVTAGELAVLDGMREVVVSEISRGVIEAAPLFDFANLDASQRENVVLQRSDAYRALLRGDGRYDVIVSEPSNPWVVGVEMLFSREFLSAARDRLRPGGVYAQWFHLYETDPATVELVIRTYLTVFEQVSVWFTKGPDVILMGFADPEGARDLARIEARASRPDFVAGLARAGIRSVPALLAHELLPLGTVRPLATPGEVHTLLHPRLSHLAARAFFRGQRARLPSAAGLGGDANQGALLARYIARDGELDDGLREEVVTELCRRPGGSCLTAVAWWQSEAPESPGLERYVGELAKRDGFRAVERDGTLAWMRALFGNGHGGEGSLTVDEARRATAVFEAGYLPALPFSRSALAEVWARCRGERCDAARRETALRLSLSSG